LPTAPANPLSKATSQSLWPQVQAAGQGWTPPYTRHLFGLITTGALLAARKGWNKIGLSRRAPTSDADRDPGESASGP